MQNLQSKSKCHTIQHSEGRGWLIYLYLARGWVIKQVLECNGLCVLCQLIITYMNELRCYEAKIEESEKAGCRQELNPGHLWLEPPVLLWAFRVSKPLSMGSFLMGRIFQSTPNRVLMTHNYWVAARCVTEAFGTTCAVHIEDCAGWLVGCSAVVARLGSTLGSCRLFHFPQFPPHNI